MTRDEFLRAAGELHDEWLARRAGLTLVGGNGFLPVGGGTPSAVDDDYHAQVDELITRWRGTSS